MLQFLALTYPQIDPIALHLGPLVIRWYALAYLGGILLGWWLLKRLNGRRSLVFPAPLLTQAAMDDVVMFATLGIVLGGRLGYVLVYDLPYFIANPGKIFAVWQGGMSFHGGLVGVLVATFLFSRKYKIHWLALMDMFAVCAPIGLFLGRLANFINGELFGRVAPDFAYAMVFPRGGELPRHPSQLYEAGLEGVLLFGILLLLAFRTSIRDRVGALGGIFLIGYGMARAVSECFREPDVQLGFFSGGTTMGQLLSFPMIVIGVGVLVWALRKPVTNVTVIEM